MITTAYEREVALMEADKDVAVAKVKGETTSPAAAYALTAADFLAEERAMIPEMRARAEVYALVSIALSLAREESK